MRMRKHTQTFYSHKEIENRAIVVLRSLERDMTRLRECMFVHALRQ